MENILLKKGSVKDGYFLPVLRLEPRMSKKRRLLQLRYNSKRLNESDLGPDFCSKTCPAIEFAPFMESSDPLSYGENLVEIRSTKYPNWFSFGLIYGDLLITYSYLIYFLEHAKFFFYVDGNKVELTVKPRSIWEDLAVLTIKTTKDLPKLKPRTKLDHKFIQGEAVQMLFLEDNEPRIETGKIQLKRRKAKVLIDSNRSFPTGTPVFNSEGIWIGLTSSRSYNSEATITNLPKFEMNRNKPPRLKAAKLCDARHLQEITDEIAKYPSKWKEIAKEYKLDQRIPYYERNTNEKDRVQALMRSLYMETTVRKFKKVLARVGLQSLAESEYLKIEHVMKF